MKFSEEEIKEIDRKLKKAEERQLKNGDKRYTEKEAWNYINNYIKEFQYL